jgi:glycosyltransferase involved in cell wall biosynthesis
MPATISAAIITLNEERNIGRCLDSLKWADEIVVVDAGSTDRTLEICKERNCRVYENAWEGFAEQKNLSLDRAACDWILSIDADEEVTPELREEIRSIIDSPSPADAYSMPRRNWFLGKFMGHGSWYPDRQLRLLRRDAGRFKIVPLHEHLELRPGARVERMTNPLLHYTYPSVSDFLRKADSYTSIAAETMVKEGRRPKSLIFSMMVAFPAKFFEVYVYKGGWKDGLHGIIAAMLLSERAFVKSLKVWEKLR